MPEKTNTEDKAVKGHISDHMRGGWGLAIAAVIILLVAFTIGISAGRFNNDRFGMHQGARMGGYMMGHGGARSSGGWASSSLDRVSGTVTAVNGSTLSVAGGGSSYQVQTSASTQYQNGSAVKVNDTVVAFGTTSSGVLTATQIVINP